MPAKGFLLPNRFVKRSGGTGALDLSGYTLTLPSDLLIQFRRGTASELAATTLANGEPGWTTDTKQLYIGDGSTAGGLERGLLNYPGIWTGPGAAGEPPPRQGTIMLAKKSATSTSILSPVELNANGVLEWGPLLETNMGSNGTGANGGRKTMAYPWPGLGRITGGSGGNGGAGSGASGGDAGYFDGPDHIIDFKVGNGGNGGTGSDAFGGQGGGIFGSLLAFRGGNAGNGGSGPNASGGFPGGFFGGLSFVQGNAGNGGTGSGSFGGGSGSFGTITIYAGGGGNGGTTGSGGDGGSSGGLSLSGGNGSDASGATNGAKGGDGGSISLSGSAAVGAVPGANAGAITSNANGNRAGGSLNLSAGGTARGGNVNLANSGIDILSGTASPEGSVTANPGALYLRSNGWPSFKGSGTGNTGWETIGRTHILSSVSDVVINNSSTLQTLTGYSVTLQPGTYKFTCAQSWSSATATAGFKLRYNFSGTISRSGIIELGAPNFSNASTNTNILNNDITELRIAC